MELLEEIRNAVATYKPNEVKLLCEKALEQGIDPRKIVSGGLIAGMAVVGEKFKKDEIFVPEVMMAAKATHAGLNVVKPVLSRSSNHYLGKVVLGTVKGDLHDIGKNLVAMMLEGAGFQVYDIGIDVPPEKFVQACRETNADIMGMSVLITTGLEWLHKTIEAVAEAGLRDKMKVMVGGAAVTPEYAYKIGADGYARDAGEAVDKARELLGIS